VTKTSGHVTSCIYGWDLQFLAMIPVVAICDNHLKLIITMGTCEANAGHVGGAHALFPVLLMQHPEVDAQHYQTIHTNIKKYIECIMKVSPQNCLQKKTKHSNF
jgi:hypothetical protein